MFAMVATTNPFQNDVIKQYRIIQGILEDKTTKRNTQNKVESMKEMPRL